jgi:hypothetical protein
MVKCLPSKHKSLNSNPSTTENKQTNKQKVLVIKTVLSKYHVSLPKMSHDKINKTIPRVPCVGG